MDATVLVGYVATFVTILSFGSGLPLCRQIYRQRSTRGIGYLPLVCGCFSTFVWLQYGLAKPDQNVLIVNALGIVLQVFYVLLYYYYTDTRRIGQATGMVAALGMFMGCVAAYVHFADPASDQVASVLGKLGSVTSVAFMASPLLSVPQVFRTGSSECLPSTIIAWSFVVSSLWVVYGLLLRDPNLYVANVIGLCITSFELLLCAWYPARTKKHS